MKSSNLLRMEKCPRFMNCSCPTCPLDEEGNIRIYLKGEEVCSLPKSTRLKLGIDMKTKGMKPKELAGLKSWMDRNKKSKSQSIEKLAVEGKKYQFATRHEGE